MRHESELEWITIYIFNDSKNKELFFIISNKMCVERNASNSLPSNQRAEEALKEKRNISIENEKEKKKYIFI